MNILGVNTAYHCLDITQYVPDRYVLGGAKAVGRTSFAFYFGDLVINIEEENSYIRLIH